ncbi:MAG TPA: hypothetical protein VGI98_00980 [Candidatus Limnocylindrales bacterium]|jgi:hypothetical protein
MNRRLVAMPATIALLLGACGGGATAPNGGNPGAPTQAAVGGGQTTPGSGSTGGGVVTIDVCAAVTAADVGAFLTKPVTAGPPPIDVQQPGFSTCHYTTSGAAAPAVLINAISTGDPSAAAAVYTGYVPGQGQPAAIQLTGIGDKAMHVPGTLDLWAIKGSVLCSVSIAGPATADVSNYLGLATPGADSQDNYPDDSMAAFDQQIGVLCNKVFAAGGQ